MKLKIAIPDELSHMAEEFRHRAELIADDLIRQEKHRQKTVRALTDDAAFREQYSMCVRAKTYKKQPFVSKDLVKLRILETRERFEELAEKITDLRRRKKDLREIALINWSKEEDFELQREEESVKRWDEYFASRVEDKIYGRYQTELMKKSAQKRGPNFDEQKARPMRGSTAALVAIRRSDPGKYHISTWTMLLAYRYCRRYKYTGIGAHPSRKFYEPRTYHYKTEHDIAHQLFWLFNNTVWINGKRYKAPKESYKRKLILKLLKIYNIDKCQIKH